MYRDYTREFLQKYAFRGSVSMQDYLNCGKKTLDKVPRKSGIYLVLYPYEVVEDLFVETGTGGHFKGKNPNVPIGELENKWVEGADILYIGKAGGINAKGKVLSSTLHQRIGTLLSFGNNKRVAHWGGRYLWQHHNYKEFKIYWYPCEEDENAIEMEKELLADFEKEYGRLPFANISR